MPSFAKTEATALSCADWSCGESFGSASEGRATGVAALAAWLTTGSSGACMTAAGIATAGSVAWTGAAASTTGSGVSAYISAGCCATTSGA